MLGHNLAATLAWLVPQTDLDPRGVVSASLLIQLASDQRKLPRCVRRRAAA